jgi:FtsZ-interacting cell division protein ZipA
MIGGAVVIIGGAIAFYLWNKNKKSKEEDKKSKEEDKKSLDKSEETKKDTETKTEKPKPITKSIEPQKSVEKKYLTRSEIEQRLKNSCGKKPTLAKNMKLYIECRKNALNKLEKDGLVKKSSFEGNNETSISDGFYSAFDNGLNLDL